MKMVVLQNISHNVDEWWSRLKEWSGLLLVPMFFIYFKEAQKPSYLNVPFYKLNVL